LVPHLNQENAMNSTLGNRESSGVNNNNDDAVDRAVRARQGRGAGEGEIFFDIRGNRERKCCDVLCCAVLYCDMLCCAGLRCDATDLT